MKRELGEKGQVVLPKDIRDYLNIKPGTKVVFEIRGGEVIIRPAKNSKEFVDYFCRTSRKLKKSVSTKAIKKTIEKQTVIATLVFPHRISTPRPASS